MKWNATNVSRNAKCLLCLLFVILTFTACNNSASNKAGDTDTLTEQQKHLPENALKGLTIADGLQVQPVATEPMLKNPTNIDVDDRGRVWVTEAYNYRPEINGNPTNPKGDRIMILEDTNGDGRADTAKVFYQGPEVNAPLGVCVLGNRVIVSQSPYVWSFYDDNGDDKADRKEILFQGIGGIQHDHGMHAFTFGPDGKLYFNFGNEGKTLKDKNGHTVRDQDGDEISPAKYKQGMVFRCDPDGSHVECLGQNFRNPYEVAVDSYGILWQSDNDDDGNKGTRINYVMDYGNYGYTDEMTGAGWQSPRTNMEDSIPLRHWHLNDPGAVPNLLQTGAGSPTGIIVYEGSLLPAIFQNQLIHCDAGPNVVRSYSISKAGAGYTATINNILKGEKDQWFRPADVCAAPDGSLMIADWYDVGVGGHQAGDQVRGRIYRVAPKGVAYTIPKEDYTTPDGAVKALQNANLAVRYKAWMALQAMGKTAVPALENLWKSTAANPRMRARAFWALVKMPGTNAAAYIQSAATQQMPEFKILALRAARELNTGVTELVKQLANDNDPQVKRECAIALHHNKSPEAPALWATLAAAYNGKDRWYLEALGIGADRQWNTYFPAFVALVKDPLQSAATADIVWRARTDAAVPYLAKLAEQKNVPLKERLKYFRAFDFNPGATKATYLLQMLTASTQPFDTALNKLVLHHLDVKSVRQSAVARQALNTVLSSLYGTDEYLQLVRQYEVTAENDRLFQMALKFADSSLGHSAASLLLSQKGNALVTAAINGKDTTVALKTIKAISEVGSKESLEILQNTFTKNSYPVNVRKAAAANLGHSWSGEEKVVELLKNKKVPQEYIPDVVASVSGAWRGAIRSEAESYLPGKAKEQMKKAPDMKTLAALTSNIANGKEVFTKTCAVCHQVNGQGYDFGPKLSEIGSKYPPEGLLNAIVHPSEGISFGFETTEIALKDGSKLTGIVASKTETDLELKYPGGGKQSIKTSDIKSSQQLKESMMPENLYASMSDQQLADLIGYLSSLKKK